MITKNKVRGCFLGTAIGDALGMPVETFSKQIIEERYGRVTELHEPKGHKWFDGEPAGMITDDTQLMLAVAEGMLADPLNPLNMDAQVNSHVAAFRHSTKGWGRSTKESVRRLANGIHWNKSGQLDGAWTGRGNGVPMKIAPIGLYMSTIINDDECVKEVYEFVENLSRMTHQTSISASAAFAQMMAVCACAVSSDSLDIKSFCQLAIKSSSLGRMVEPNTIGEDDLTERLFSLLEHDQYNTEKMIDEFGAGSCYCYHSIPFTLMHFVKNPNSIDSLYDVVSAGGDTDSNGAMLGALLGTLHGESIFPENLVQGIEKREEILALADKFWDFLS